MKRDFELVRKLLFFFEEKAGPKSIPIPPIEGYSEHEIMHHCVLLYDAGLLRCESVKSSSSGRVIEVIPFDLTWDGHEFLDKIRSDTVWSRVKSQVEGKGVTLSFNLINELAKNAIFGMLGA